MSAHTPGPWVVESPDAGELVIVAASGREDVEDLAVINASKMVHPNARANASVMAAAPEMLAALKVLAPTFYGKRVDLKIAAAVEQACRAIAKAEGKS